MDEEMRSMQVKLNSLTKTDNPNQIAATFIVHDFEASFYGDVISEEICQGNMKYLVGQYICCGYVPREKNDGEDALLDHMVIKEINRDTGKEMQNTGTIPIGHITDAYIGDYDDKRVLFCKAILWVDKFYNIVSLLDEWLTNDIPIPCSCEYRFMNYSVSDGVNYIQSPVYYKSLCLLNAEDRGNIKQVYPAYDSSCLVGYEEKFNQAIQKDIDVNSSNGIDNKNNGKGEVMENVFLTALNDISFGEIRDKIMVALAKVMVADEYNKLWISNWDVYDTYFIYETYNGEEWIRFKVDYAKTEDDEIEVDFEGRKQVVRQDVYVEVATMQESMNAIETEKEAITTSLNSANEKITELENEVLESQNAQVELNTTIESLNARVEELSTCEKELTEIKYNERLDEAKETYKAEFEVFNGVDVFETEEVQKLIVETLDETTSFNAIVKIKDAILECAKANKPAEQVSMNSANNNVIEKNRGLNSSLPTEKTFGFRVQ